MSNLNSKSDNSEGKNKRPSDYLQTLERGLDVIKAFRDRPPLTISESSKITGLPRSVTRRALITLEKLGYVNSKEGRFSLTPKILSLGYSYISSHNIWEMATPYIKKLSEKIEESCSIAVLDDTEVVFVAHIPVSNILKYSLGVGARLPAHASSMGIALLAYLPSDNLDRYFQNTELHSYTTKTITSEKKIREILEKVHSDGWALCQDQLEEGLISIAAPIRDVKGKVVASVNCSTNSGRCDIGKVLNDYLPLLLDTAEQISKNLDFEIIQ